MLELHTERLKTLSDAERQSHVEENAGPYRTNTVIKLWRCPVLHKQVRSMGISAGNLISGELE